MKHSVLISIVEQSISSQDIEIINIRGVSTHVVDKADYEVAPGKKLRAGMYGVVEMRVILPIR